MGHSTYLVINLLTIALPLIFSFGKKVRFISDWKYFLISALLTLLVFIPWDMAFTALGIWGFNKEYILGIFIGGIPLEEYLFFITIPYLYLFIYSNLKFYVKNNFLKGVHFVATSLLIIGLIILLISSFDRTYTATALAFLVLMLMIQLVNRKRYMGRFYLSFIVCSVPYLIINGILTSLPAIWYHNEAISPIKLGTVPVDNMIYNAGLLLIVIMGFEWSKRKFFKSSLTQ